MSLKFNDVYLGYGNSLVVQGVSMTLNEGDRVCLLGGNGSGKSTLIKGLFGLVELRKGSIELYVQGNRDDLVKKEENEIKIISNFLPSQLSKQEIDEIINSTIKSNEVNSMKDMGMVIKIIKEQYDGMMDFGYVSKVIKEKLSNL